MVHCADSIKISNDVAKINVAPHTEYWVDTSRERTFEQILQDPPDFTDLKSNAANFGMTGHAYWFRFDLDMQQTESPIWLLAIEYSNLDFVDFYMIHEDGSIVSRSSGDRRKFSERQFQHRYPLFQIPLQKGEKASIYLRVQTDGATEVPMHLVTKSAFFAADHDEQYFRGIFFGVLGIMFLYNLALWIGSRNIEYLALGFWMLSFLGLKTSIDGLALEYFWGNSIWWSNLATPFFLNFGYFMPAACAYTFLPMRDFPRLRKFTQATLVTFLAFMFLCFFLPYRALPIYIAIGTSSMIVIMVSSVYVWLKGFRPARFFFTAWIMILLGAIVYALQKNGITPVHFLGTYALEIGGIVQSVLLSLGQSEKIYEINRAIRKANEKALAAQIEVNRVTENMKAELEKQVLERTHTIRTIIDNVRSGFLLIGPDHCVMEGFTKSCRDILGQTIEIGMQFTELFDLDKRSRDHVDLSLDQVFTDLLPEEASLRQIGERFSIKDRIIKCQAAVVRNNDGHVQSILFTLNDNTELEQAENENFHNQSLLNIIRDQLAFKAFIQEALEELQQAMQAISNSKNHQTNLLLHTLKGNFASFGLNAISEHIHELEWKDTLCASDLQSLSTAIQAFIDANQDIFGFDHRTIGEESYHIRKADLDEIKSKLQTTNDPKVMTEILQEWEHELRQTPVKRLIHHLEDNLYRLAHKMNKEVSFKVIGGHTMIDQERYRDVFQNLVHLIRNSIDHGIEYPEDRGDKPTQGQITFEVEKNESVLKMSLADDGAGIDLEKLKQRILSKGLLPACEFEQLDKDSLLKYIFVEGFSTREDVTILSGRGMGLPALKSSVDELAGKITVNTKTGLGTRVEIEFPLSPANQLSPSKHSA